jgi:hypothetical protein
MSNFEPNAILRGAQLTVVGSMFSRSEIDIARVLTFILIAVRALRNPQLFKHEHFRQAALAVAIGVAIHLVVQIPVGVFRPKYNGLLTGTCCRSS